MDTHPSPDNPDASDSLHQPLRALLPECATWQACGNDPSQRYPEVMAHVATCESCRQVLDELVSLLNGFEQPVPSLAPSIRPDLSFLSGPTPSPPVPELAGVDGLGHWLVLFSRSFLDLFNPPPQYGMARGSLKTHRLRDARSGSTLILELRESKEADVVSLLIQVDWPNQDALEQGGSRVTVRAADQQWEGVTDDMGSIEFGALPRSLLPGLRLAVSPPPEG